MKCPYYQMKLTKFNYNGIRCVNGLYFQRVGEEENWNKETRDNHVMLHCENDYNNCPRYKILDKK